VDRKTLKGRLLASSVIAGGMAVAAPGAFAQEEDTEARQETVVVTGSRIAKQDFVSNSPIATVDAEVFELTGSINTEDVLNTLPQAVPGLDRTSNNPGDGTATANLRGLGSSRTLVLMDGRRVIPSRSDGVVDLNNIPAALIERVEVVTGGASAVYGSDAIAGVVNFIMKDDFEGFEANMGYEATVDQGDAEFYTADVTIGANFDNDRGNVTLNLGYTNRKDVFQGDREFSNVALGGFGGDFFEFGSSGVPDGHSFDTFDFTALGQAGAPVYTIDPRTPDMDNMATFSVAGACDTAGTGAIDPDGSLAVLDEDLNPLTPTVSGDEFCGGQAIFAGPDGFRPWINGGAGNDRYNYAPVNYLQLPQERYSATALANYDINENLNVYTSLNVAFNQVPQQLAPTPAFTSITTAIDNPFLSAEAQQAFANFDAADDNDGSVTTFIGRRMEETGGRVSNDDRYAYQFQAGAKGTILDDGVDFDIYFQSGQSQNNNDLEGDISLTRYLQAVNVTDDGDGNAVCVDPSGGCVPLNIFGAGNISQEAADFVSLRINAKTEYNQNILGINFAGDSEALFTLPGGAIGWATGFEYREEEFEFRPSDALSQGALLGFNAAPAVKGGFDVYDLYAEFYAPILKDQPGAELLAIEGAFRYSDYSTIGSTETYKIGGEWSPIEGLRVRGLYNTAVRAPNIGELFTPQSNGFPGAQDPCSTSNQPVANGIAALCAATGVPAAQVGDTPEGDDPNPAFFQQRNDQVEGLFNGQNPNLAQEEAKTFTIGAVFEPAFLDGFVIAVDYYDIEITDYITTLGGGAQGVFDQCYGTGFNPNLDPANPFCQAINRGASGESNPILPNANSGFLQTAGIDIQADYSFEFEAVPGNFTANYTALLLDTWDFQASAASDVRSCAGQFGNFCDDPIPDYKHLAALGWSNGPFTTQLRWEHIGETESDDGGRDQIEAFNYFNLNGAWDINDNLRLSGGIDNLLDEEPPILGSNAEQANTFPATYDVYGRTFYVNAKVRF